MLTFFYQIPRRLKIFIIFLLLIASAYFLAMAFTVKNEKKIPPDFLRAQQSASVSAGKIVEISNNTAKDIAKISDLNKEKKYDKALNFVSEELKNNSLARNNAIDLSNQLAVMAGAVSQISPIETSQSAIEAISSETMLISHLINYNDYLVQLLEILQQKFLGKENDADDKIADLINKINNEAQTINSLDNKFQSLMKSIE